MPVRAVVVAAEQFTRVGLLAQLDRDGDAEVVEAAESVETAGAKAPELVLCARPEDAQAARVRWPSARIVLCADEPLGSARGTQPKLTERERNVLAHVSAGLSTRAIAELLAISEHTVHSHLRWAMHKLSARTRTAAVHNAVLQGLL